MIMLVIHPKDKTTAMLSALYDGLEAQVVDDYRSTNVIGHLLHHVSKQERIMLLGHGSDKGLFFREDDSKDEFDKLIVGHSHAYHLRNHRGNSHRLFQKLPENGYMYEEYWLQILPSVHSCSL